MKIYLDTSVWSFLYAKDVPEKQKITKKLFEEIKQGFHEVFISPTVLMEITRTRDEILRDEMMRRRKFVMTLCKIIGVREMDVVTPEFEFFPV